MFGGASLELAFIVAGNRCRPQLLQAVVESDQTEPYGKSVGCENLNSELKKVKKFCRVEA